MKDWIDFKKSFTQKQEDALWQYFIDHSQIQSNGFYGIMFYIRDIDDFWKRLFARYNGDYARYDKLEKQHRNEMLFVHITHKKADRNGKISSKIDEGNNLYKKMILWIYRKSRDYLF